MKSRRRIRHASSRITGIPAEDAGERATSRLSADLVIEPRGRCCGARVSCWPTAVLRHPSGFGAVRNACSRRLAGVVTHVFTHFPLELVVYRKQVPQTEAA